MNTKSHNVSKEVVDILKDCPSPSTEILQSSGTSQELHQVRMIFSNVNDLLSKIHRLSLGNPRIQSMKETFVAVEEVLEDVDPLMQHYRNLKIPCIDCIGYFIGKMKKIANMKRPSEKHIEQLKMLLGDCDGRVLIVAKFLSVQEQCS